VIYFQFPPLPSHHYYFSAKSKADVKFAQMIETYEGTVDPTSGTKNNDSTIISGPAPAIRNPT
jgi:hypothetical protein